MKKLHAGQEQYIFEVYFRAVKHFEPKSLERLGMMTEEAKELCLNSYIHDYLGKFKDEDAVKRHAIMPERFKGMDIDEVIAVKREENS